MGALLTTFGIDWHLLIAQSINFVILAVALTWLLYKPVLTMVKERERVVAKGVEDAEESAKLLSQADAEAGKRVDAAEKSAEEIVERARHAAAGERAKILKEAEERAKRVAGDAEARARETAAESLRKSEKEIARLALLAAEKVLRKES
jgi:F-type H+-transporting ATPase subunit b